MKLNDYQTDARKTAIGYSPEHMAFGLLEESGEIAGVMKRWWRGDIEYLSDKDHLFSDFAVERIKGELGDVLWYTAMLADVFGITLEDVAKYNLAKLQRRRAKDMIHGSGDDR